MSGKTSSKVKNDWNKKNYDRIALSVPKGTKDKWKEQAKKEGYSSLNKYIIGKVEGNPPDTKPE